MTGLVVHASWLFDATGTDPTIDAGVRIEDARIVAIGADLSRTGAEVLDLDGLTLLPGLIDLHTHMGITSIEDLGSATPAVTAAMLFRNTELCLMSGHTTAREVAGADGGLKEAIDRGLVLGPRLYPSGPMLCQTGGHGHFGPLYTPHELTTRRFGLPGLAHVSEICDGVDEVRIAARQAFRRGATQLKMCVSGGVVSLTDDLHHTQFSVEELKAAVHEAAARDTYVTAHAHNADSVNLGLDAGLECFEHGTFLDEPTARRMADAGAALVPTFAVTRLARDNHEAWGIPKDMLPRLDGVAEAMADSLLLARDAGVMVGSGTDLLGPEQNRRGLEISLKAEVIGAQAALESATRVNAGILRLGEDLGTIEVGKYADLIAVDGDPLDDPELFDDPDRVIVVIKGGEIVKDLR